MRENKEGARLAAATVKRAAEPGANNHESPESHLNCTTAAEVRQIQIKDFLLTGAENAVPRRHLRQLTSLSDRELRRRIQEARLAGCPILSDNASGYFLPSDEEEKQRFIRSMRSRAREIEAVAAAVEAGV